MANPGEGVAHNKHEDEVGGWEGDKESVEELDEGEGGTDDVEATAGAVGVLRKVERIELVQSWVSAIHINCYNSIREALRKIKIGKI